MRVRQPGRRIGRRLRPRRSEDDGSTAVFTQFTVRSVNLSSVRPIRRCGDRPGAARAEEISRSVGHGSVADRRFRPWSGRSCPASRRRWRRCWASGIAPATSAQKSRELLCVRWVSSWTTVYSMRAGLSIMARQLKRSVPPGAQLPQRCRWSRTKMIRSCGRRAAQRRRLVAVVALGDEHRAEPGASPSRTSPSRSRELAG